MSQDIVADGLNQMMNALRARKTSLELRRHSKLLTAVLALAKLKGYIKDYRMEDNVLKIEIGKLNGCNAIKPRFVVGTQDLEKYVLRYLPAKEIGIIIVSTPEGLMTHQTAIEKNLGGSLIAYIF